MFVCSMLLIHHLDRWHIPVSGKIVKACELTSHFALSILTSK